MVLIVTRGGRRWQLPKGWLEQGEIPREAARREVREETGLKGNILEELGTIDYWFNDRHTIRVHKFVTFYLMAYESGDISRFDPTEVDAALWVSMEEAINQISFDSEREILRKAQEVWPQHTSVQG